MSTNGLTFRDDEAGQLVVSYLPHEGDPVPDCNAASLRAAATAAGYGDLAFDATALEHAGTRIRQGLTCTAAIARRLPAEYRIEVAPNRMTVWMTVVAPRGGAKASIEDAAAALRGRGVRVGVDDAKLAEAVAKPEVRCEVAFGVAPVPGKDGWLEPLVTVNQQRHPHVDATGHVDYHDLGAIPSVNAGDPIMRRHPPCAGTPGRTVAGDAIPAPTGKDIQFGVGLHGVDVSKEDADLLLAETAGQPILQRDGVGIEPIIRFPEVNLAVGNVEFVGSVEVAGDVHSGMKIHAGGDIIVKGVVESAELHAGGDVKVQGGIIGHASPHQGGHAEPGSVATARIHARGNVRARYIENAVVEAEQSVFVAESVIESMVTAIDKVEVGGRGGKGRILGGLVRATSMVSADCVGGAGAGPTRVVVGVNPMLQRTLEEHKHLLDAKLKEHGDILKVVTLLATRPDKRDMLDKARLTLKKVGEEIAQEMEDERVIQAEMKLADHASVVVGSRVESGATVVIGRRSWYASEELGRGVFHLDGKGELTFGTLAAPAH